MKVEIKIECDDIQDLKMHLSVIRGQILNRAKQLNSEEVIGKDIMSFEDSNCYGNHQVKITEYESKNS
jgi:ribosomal protein L9